MTIQKVVRIVRIEEQGNDLAYWLSRTPQERLAALEEIRQEYHRWKYGAEPGFQRVLTIVEQ